MKKTIVNKYNIIFLFVFDFIILLPAISKTYHINILAFAIKISITVKLSIINIELNRIVCDILHFKSRTYSYPKPLS